MVKRLLHGELHQIRVKCGLQILTPLRRIFDYYLCCTLFTGHIYDLSLNITLVQDKIYDGLSIGEEKFENIALFAGGRNCESSMIPLIFLRVANDTLSI
jgi:hypothetical protein